jgi:hypothetical protein
MTYYKDPDVIRELSRVAGCPLYTVPSKKTVDQAVQIYNTPGDSANWHHDRSIFNGGRTFTFLTVVHNTSNQELTVWTKKYGIEKLRWSVGKSVLIEKFVTYHSVTPLEYGSRILLTLTYTEKPYSPTILHPVEYTLNKMKNYSYLGMGAFTAIDYIIVVSTLTIFVVLIYKLISTKSARSDKKKTKRNTKKK